MILSRNLAATNKDISQFKKPRKNTYQQIEDNNGEDEEKNNNNIFQTMCTSFLCHTKFESNLGHKGIFNCAMSYFVILMITDLEFSENLENDKINLGSDCNPMASNRTMLEI